MKQENKIRNLDFLKSNLIAHRGVYNINEGIPENSMLAFEKAIEKNYIIELDVHVLNDGKVVVFHDDNLKRMTGMDKNLNEMIYDEIRLLKLQKTDQKISLFEDVLKLIDGKVPILIELKYDTKCGLLEEKVVELLKKYKGIVAIESFNPFSILKIKKLDSRIIRGQLVSNFKNEKMNIIKKIILKNMMFNIITKPDFISCDIKMLPNKKIKKIRKNKIVIGWLVKNDKDMTKAKIYCDNIICENI